MNQTLDLSNWSCPIPLRDYPRIVLGHGGGGQLTAELIEHLFLPAFHNPVLAGMADAAIIPAPKGRMAFTTDSFVVQPLFFPGGSIGSIAVNGTVNDLAMCGAKPLYLSAGFILEEGLPLETLARVLHQMAEAAQAAEVCIIAGDTKVVEKGHGDGIFIATTGIGEVPEGICLGMTQVVPGDVVIVSGTIGDHGMAVMSVRENLQFSTLIESDCAALHPLVDAMLQYDPSAVHMLRDPTRGGVATVLNEIAQSSKMGIILDEDMLPVKDEVQAACELLGLDPLFVANEGKLLAIVASNAAEFLLNTMRAHPLGKEAAIIGRVTLDHPGMLVSKTSIGGTRVIAMQIGEQLPRIC